MKSQIAHNFAIQQARAGGMSLAWRVAVDTYDSLRNGLITVAEAHEIMTNAGVPPPHIDMVLFAYATPGVLLEIG